MVIVEETDPIDSARTIKVVIGDLTENIGQMICDALSENSDGQLTIETAVTLQSDELIELVQTNDFDIALLVLNNIIFDIPREDIRKRMETGMQLVSELRHRYGVPVIALYGAPRDEVLGGQIVERGANFASLIPCEWKDIESAFYNCLRQDTH